MGKASRTKREKRQLTNPQPPHKERRRLPIFWMVIGAIVLGAFIALLVADSTKDPEVERAGKQAPAYADVEIEGSSLESWSGQGADPAQGDQVPSITGTSFKNKPLAIGQDGAPKVIVVLAHWCAHCQAEVPRIVEWAEDGGLPEGVDVYGISTAASKSQPNFPPAAWLAKERWPYETLVDDEASTAADALGVEGFPFIIFVDADGKVTQRYSGEMPIEEFDAAVQEIAP